MGNHAAPFPTFFFLPGDHFGKNLLENRYRMHFLRLNNAEQSQFSATLTEGRRPQLELYLVLSLRYLFPFTYQLSYREAIRREVIGRHTAYVDIGWRFDGARTDHP